jgi:hypothetical protein
MFQTKGCMWHALLCTRPDVEHAQVSRAVASQTPVKKYWTTVKDILKLLTKTKDLFLVYGGSGELKIRRIY